MKPSATTVSAAPLATSTSRAVEAGRSGSRAKTLDDVEAQVMPEQITAKATRNVTKWMPNALCV